MHRLFLKKMLIAITIILIYGTSGAQEKKLYSVSCIGFYNLENLFDTIPGPNDDEFTPEGANKYTSERYWHKVNHMSEVISQMGAEMFPGGPAILGVCEIENRSVMEDLIAAPALKQSNYSIVHYDSPDRRGVDVGLLYRPEFFTVTSTRSVRLKVAEDTAFRTRDQLVVDGLLSGEQIHIIVNHWPSRGGGEKRSMPIRMAAAKLTKSIVDSLQKAEPEAKIIIMGDLNDDPDCESITKGLGAKITSKNLKSGELFNAMASLYKEGIGTLAYRDSWNLFDNLIVTKSLINEDKTNWVFFKAKVFNKPFLQQSSGQFAGYPFRTYVGNSFTGGYSDHFPVYLFLIKEKK